MVDASAPGQDASNASKPFFPNRRTAIVAIGILTFICAIPVIWLGLYMWGGRGYVEKQKLLELTLRGRADAERMLERKWFLRTNPDRADWSLSDQTSHTLLSGYTISENGTVKLDLRGHDDLYRKSLVLKPTILEGKATWSCSTDIEMRFCPHPCRNSSN